MTHYSVVHAYRSPHGATAPMAMLVKRLETMASGSWQAWRWPIHYYEELAVVILLSKPILSQW
jgi:hypothetical protein